MEHLTKKDVDKLYGPDGLYNRLTYFRKVIESCRTKEQLKAASKWSHRVLGQLHDSMEKDLHPPFSLFVCSDLSYELLFLRRYREIGDEITRIVKKQLEKISRNGEEG